MSRVTRGVSASMRCRVCAHILVLPDTWPSRVRAAVHGHARHAGRGQNARREQFTQCGQYRPSRTNGLAVNIVSTGAWSTYMPEPLLLLAVQYVGMRK